MQRHNALANALERVGDRWSLLVVEALLAGPRRFGDLQEALQGVATNVLSQRLRHLQSERLVVANLYQSAPPRYVYQLTEHGKGLAGPLRLIEHWGAEQAEPATAPLAHAACGGLLEPRWYCSSCGEVVGDEFESQLFYV